MQMQQPFAFHGVGAELSIWDAGHTRDCLGCGL